MGGFPGSALRIFASASQVAAVLLFASGSGAEPAVTFSVANQQARFAFRHTSGASGERHFIETMGPGCAFLDYNGDGNLDIYMVNGHALPPEGYSPVTNALYRNDGDGTFTDVTEQAGVGDTGYGVGVTAADYDNDGDTDLYITNYGPNVLYRNNGDGTFTDVTEKAGVGDGKWGVGCAFLDYDQDGYLDLYVANYVEFSLENPKQIEGFYVTREAGQKLTRDATGYPHPDNFSGVPDVLYRNNGDGTFADVTREAGIFNPEGKGMGISCGDYDGDGDIDIYVANDLTPNFLFENNGDGTFAEVALMAGVAYNEDAKMESSMGVDFGDYNRDGFLDLIVPNFQGEASTLYRNNGDGSFVDLSSASGVGLATRPFVGWGVGFLDYDNDGEFDLFIATGHILDNVEQFDTRTTYSQRNFLFRNNGPGPRGVFTFTDQSAVTGQGLALVKPSRGVALGDYDNDGDIDILVVNCNDEATLLRNDGGNQGHWLRVKTEGTISNRDGIGARVKVIAGKLAQIREVRSGSSLYSLNDLRVSFGLGERTTVDRVEVRWPSGMVDSVAGPPIDGTIVIREKVGLVGFER